MTTYTAEQIEAIGGHRWTKADKDRVYVNKDIWTKLIGLEVSNYNSGNISGATLDGDRISNSAAYDILTGVEKVYWDSADNQIHIIGFRNRYFDRTATWIRDGIAEAVAALPSDDDDKDEPTAAEQVNTLRQAGRSARDIAEMIGVAISTIYRWARGICQPRPINAAALAALTV